MKAPEKGAAPTAAASELAQRKKRRRERKPPCDSVDADMVVAPLVPETWARNMYIAPGGFTQLKRGRAAAAGIRKPRFLGARLNPTRAGREVKKTGARRKHIFENLVSPKPYHRERSSVGKSISSAPRVNANGNGPGSLVR